MRWDSVMESLTARWLEDSALRSIMNYKDFVFEGEAGRAVKIPSIEYAIVGDTEEETFNPIDIQVDSWIEGVRKAAQIERRLKWLTHSPVAQELDGERMWLTYRGRRRGSYTAKPGITHTILFFEAKPVSAFAM